MSSHIIPVYQLPIHASDLCDWYVARFGLPFSGQDLRALLQDQNPLETLSVIAQLFYQDYSRMNAQINVDPTLKFTLDVATFVKLETAVSFYRNSHPTLRDADLDQLSAMLKSMIAKVREYDSALRGLIVSTSSTELKADTVDPPPAASPGPPSAPAGGFPAIELGPAVQPTPPGAPPPSVLIRRPGSAPPPTVELSGPVALPPIVLEKPAEVTPPPFNMEGTQTGRLSGDKPNPGNSPKTAFVAPPGTPTGPPRAPGSVPGAPPTLLPNAPPRAPVAPPAASAPRPPAASSPPTPGAPPPPPLKF